MLGAAFTGSSNTYLAYKHDLEAMGTNAHELPMALAALANTDDELRIAQYRLLELWQQSYQGELLILLPDTFGTTQFLRNAPDWVGRLDGPAHRQQRPFHRRRRVHCLANSPRARSAPQAAHCIRCSRCGSHPRAARALWRKNANERNAGGFPFRRGLQRSDTAGVTSRASASARGGAHS